MKKRFASLLVAVLILLGVASMGVSAETVLLDASDACIEILKQEEGFSAKPYWDYLQYTVGYGTKCPDDLVAYYTQNGISEEEAETLLRNHLNGVVNDINVRLVQKYDLTLSQNQFDAIVLFSYNCGTGWLYNETDNLRNAIVNGATGNEIIDRFSRWCNAGGQVQTFLLRRRLSEANMYLNNVYSKTPPDNFGYVLYDANGGTTYPRVQGYDTALTSAIVAEPAYSGFTFKGWFTEKNGGTQVTVLDASVKNTRLYAHWVDAQGNAPVVETINVTVTVTGTMVNLRQGPGTNYSIVGQANTGDQKVITEVQEAMGYTWGKFEGGWIALEYTNYDSVKDAAPETSAPEQATPEESTPEETTPPATETTPPTTESTTPVQPETTATVTGTVNVNDYLRVRSGPGTGYSIVEYLKPNAKVEILEQQTVGYMVWGKISNGWVSMDYIVLDKTDSGDSGSAGATGSTVIATGTVVNAGSLRIRSGPGTHYSILGYLTDGNRVEITEKQTSGSMVWGKISNGWISLDYVQLDGGSTGSTGSTGNTETVTGTVKVNDFLRVRSGPGTSYAVAGYLGPNEKVTITERRSVGSTTWGKISNGWISLDYVVLDNGAASSGSTASDSGQTVTKTIVADCLRIRSDAGTSNAIVGYLYYGAKVQITETKTAADGTLWGRVSQGWISMDYAK